MSNSVRPHRQQPIRLPCLGFSRQEHWSGLPFPSPMHESEKWKVKMKSLSRVRPSATPWTASYQAPLPMDFPGKSTGMGRQCLLRQLFLGDQLRHWEWTFLLRPQKEHLPYYHGIISLIGNSVSNNSFLYFTLLAWEAASYFENYMT